MAVRGRKRPSLIDVPTRVVLAPEGVSFFMERGCPLHRFDVAEKIELQVRDAHRSKEALEDAVRLVIFAMLRRSIPVSASERAFDSTMIRNWNRANPKRSIVPAPPVGRRAYPLVPGAIIRGGRRAALFVEEAISSLDSLVLFVLVGSVGRERTELHGAISDRAAKANAGKRLGGDGLCFYYLGVLSVERRKRGVAFDEHMGEAADAVITTLINI